MKFPSCIGLAKAALARRSFAQRLSTQRLFTGRGPFLSWLALTALAVPASGQNTFWSEEPNNTKDTANEAFEMAAGDRLAILNCFSAAPNVFRVRTAPAAPAIYEHRLSSNFSSAFRRAEIWGRDAFVDDVLPNSFARLSTSDDAGPSQPFVSWYGFGKSEEVYVNLVDLGSCRSTTSLNMSTTVITPVSLPFVFAPNDGEAQIELQATGTGSVSDVELHLFDAEFNAVPGGWSDEPSFSSGGGARLNLSVLPGRYYLAVSETGMASHLPPTAEVGEVKVPNEALDFSGGLVAGGSSTGMPILVRVSGLNSTGGSATVLKNASFEVRWLTFEVGMSQQTETFCPGDGTAMACPCGMDAPVGSGMGCVNSTGRGASIMYSASGVAGSQRLTLDDLPANAAGVLFLGLGTQAPSGALGGVACLGAGAFRFPPFAANAAGTAVQDLQLLTLPPVLMGQTVYAQAGYRDSIAPPCNVNLTSGTRFTLR